ncbi:MAG: ferritin family protein [Spirochaetota bacterium]
MQKAIELLKLAIMAEQDGYHHYMTASAITTDKKAQEVFRALAKDEELHRQTLLDGLDSYSQNKKWNTDKIKGKSKVSTAGKSPIFSEEFVKRIKDKHYEMSALSIGILLEQSSIDFYGKMKSTTKDPKLKSLLTVLVNWEKKHLEALVKQQKLFMSAYWEKARFQPF